MEGGCTLPKRAASNHCPRQSLGVLEAGSGERAEIIACEYAYERWDFAIRALKEDMK